MLPDAPVFAVFLAAVVTLTAGGLGDWLRRHPRVQRAQAWVTASILAGLALRIALPGNR